VSFFVHDAFQRPRAPEGFAERVLARASARRRAERLRIWIAASILLAIGLGLGSEWQRRREAERTAAAVRQAFVLAHEKVARANQLAAAQVERSFRYLKLMEAATAASNVEVQEGVNP
jgi:hypothetical protein